MTMALVSSSTTVVGTKLIRHFYVILPFFLELFIHLTDDGYFQSNNQNELLLEQIEIFSYFTYISPIVSLQATKPFNRKFMIILIYTNRKKSKIKNPSSVNQFLSSRSSVLSIKCTFIEHENKMCRWFRIDWEWKWVFLGIYWNILIMDC